jgi:hypothetical protein
MSTRATIEVQKIAAADWMGMSQRAHLIVFGKDKPASWDRIDYAWLATFEDKPLGYVQCRELDHESVYWQFGGGFPWARNSISMVRMTESFLSHEKARGIKRIAIRVENTNKTMLKLALSLGWLVNGVMSFQGTILVEMINELAG